ncbi:hypothetical protein HN51_058672 [Arachis hypogaea]|uniref:Omega-hydroxypalmitate O-feruloyl transferase n=1 Tax=Arachis hypogaea TaxID=3818 RepID=A0A444X228_ARAHY|nr:omega-hydroxypalmitate O-feruloyl transferase-like [Arachis ipaensis]XP_025682459.1 omega-hydroxypalmitate O-feruloyl transferase [Arachis hypogaea]QHN81988.1 Omega-hydroxypalmitate O-feruloyl transferase [Arachis hypogaea]RYQ83731.1 hypothetical protein Ahy_B10g102538 [Arachis hypogaea]
MATTSVRVKEAVLVTPSDPTPTGILHLSALDSQLFLRFTVEYLFVYRRSSALDQPATVSRMKSALARALVPYYPFAGRVRSRPDVPSLEVVCRAQGALFIDACSDVYTANDFEKAPKTVTQWRKLLSLYVPDVLKGSPPLVVQLTWLADGAAAVGVGINHALCDGIGSAEFLNYFANLASQRFGPRDSDLKPKPVWDRHIMNPPSKKNERANTYNHPEFARVPDLCGFLNKVTTGLRPTSIVFNKRRINELKGVARYSSESSSSYTSFEVLAAHVWRSWARALGFPPNQQLKILFSINVRNRVKPNLPEGYYGNAFVLGCAQSSAKELVEKGIGYCSGLVKRAKERVDGEYVRRVSELVSEWRVSPDPVGVLIVSQWSRLGLERVEFMGRPIHVGPICWDRYCLFLPVRDETESVRVAVAVPAAAFDSYHRFIAESTS